MSDLTHLALLARTLGPASHDPAHVHFDRLPDGTPVLALTEKGRYVAAVLRREILKVIAAMNDQDETWDARELLTMHLLKVCAGALSFEEPDDLSDGDRAAGVAILLETTAAR